MKTRIPHEPSAEAILAAVADLRAAEARVVAAEAEVPAEIRARLRRIERDRAVQRPCDVEPQFDDHSSHQPSGFVLHLDVPHPDGPRHCARDCPVCYGGEANGASVS